MSNPPATPLLTEPRTPMPRNNTETRDRLFDAFTEYIKRNRATSNDLNDNTQWEYSPLLFGIDQDHGIPESPSDASLIS